MAKTRFPIIDIEGPATVKLSLEERYATLLMVYKYQYFAGFRLIEERYGQEVADEIYEEISAQGIPEIVQGYKQKFGLPGEGAALVSQVLASEFQAEGGDFAALHESEESAEYTVLCAFGDAIQSGRFDDVDVSKALCERSCWNWTQVAANSVDESLHVDRKEWMGDGAPRCRFTIEQKA